MGELFIVFMNVSSVAAVLDFLYIGLLFCIWLLKQMLFYIRLCTKRQLYLLYICSVLKVLDCARIKNVTAQLIFFLNAVIISGWFSCMRHDSAHTNTPKAYF